MSKRERNPTAASPPRVLAKGRYLTFIEEDGWEYVTRPGVTGIVVIVAVTDAERLVLVEQYRPAVHRRVVDPVQTAPEPEVLPAGQVLVQPRAVPDQLHS